LQGILISGEEMGNEKVPKMRFYIFLNFMKLTKS